MKATLLFAFAWLAVVPSYAADEPLALRSKEIKWVDVAAPVGAQQAVLWENPQAGDSGRLVRWKFNSKVSEQMRDQNLHVVVLSGTLTLEMGGRYKELGPGGVATIPKGIRHALGCEAAGDCTFVMHLGGS